MFHVKHPAKHPAHLSRMVFDCIGLSARFQFTSIGRLSRPSLDKNADARLRLWRSIERGGMRACQATSPADAAPPLRPFRASFARLESQPGGAHFRCLPPLHLNLAFREGARDNFYLFIFLFHVKRFVRVNKAISLTYTKFAEDHVQHILDVDPAE